MGAGASTAPDAAKGISFEQLEAAVAQQPAEVQARWSSDTLKTAFQQHDADGDGLLSKAEYDAALAATGSSGDVKDFGRDLPGAAEAAGMRQDQEEAIDTAMMMSAPKRKWDGRHMDEAIESVALSLAHEVTRAPSSAVRSRRRPIFGKPVHRDLAVPRPWRRRWRAGAGGHAVRRPGTRLKSQIKTNEKCTRLHTGHLPCTQGQLVQNLHPGQDTQFRRCCCPVDS
jgi:hypothetical protein